MAIAKAYWHKSENYGDQITPYLIKRLLTADEEPDLVPITHDKYLVFTGSILREVGSGAIVWGAGISSMFDRINQDATYLAVRGPISKSKINKLSKRMDCAEGDPALVLPFFYTPKTQPSTDNPVTGLITSWVDADRIPKESDLKIIKSEQSVESFIDEVFSCSEILSTTLHGLITAIAYGVPCSHIRLSNKMMGDGVKYKDFFYSIGYFNEKPIDLSENFDESFKRYSKDRSFLYSTTTLNLRRFIEACPIEWGS